MGRAYKRHFFSYKTFLYQVKWPFVVQLYTDLEKKDTYPDTHHIIIIITDFFLLQLNNIAQNCYMC